MESTDKDQVEIQHKKINTINLATPFNRREIFADCGFTFTAAQQWNKLPSHMKSSTNIKEF